MKNTTKTRRPYNLLTLLLIVPLFLSIASCSTKTEDPNLFELNKANTPQGLSTSVFENKTQTIKTKEFVYENARSLKNYHVELDTSGLIYNKDTSPIVAITSIKVVFETKGTVSLATSSNGVEYSSAFIKSGTVNDTTTKPTYFKIVANESAAKIASIIIKYSAEGTNSSSEPSSEAPSIIDSSSTGDISSSETESSSEIISSSETSNISEDSSSSEVSSSEVSSSEASSSEASSSEASSSESSSSETIPPVELVALKITESKTEYKIGDVYLNTNSLVVKALYSDDTYEELSYDGSGTSGYALAVIDPSGNVFYPATPFAISGAYQVSATYLDVVSNKVTINVKGATVNATATIDIKPNSVNDSTLITDPASYLIAEGIEIKSATTSNVYGGNNTASLRFASGKNDGSLTITFKDSVLISGVTLSVSPYNKDTPSIKVVTSANPTGQALTAPSGVSSLSYTAFNNDTTESNSITISSAKSNRFHLYSISLTIGKGEPVAVTGLTLSPSALNVGVGQTGTITANVLPSKATNKAVTWTTNDSTIATVSAAGVVSGVALGETTISATTVEGGFSATATVTVVPVTYDNYERATNVDPNFNLQDLKKHGGLNAIPSVGEDINVLVIPVEISDYPFGDGVLDDIETAFNGTPEETGYWHSVNSFYKESSYEKLDLSFTVADPYVPGMNAKQLAGLESGVQYFTQNVLRNAISDYKAKNGNSSTQKFDSDTDGFIDAVWMIYSAPNYSNNKTIQNISTDYWAYVFWDYEQADSGSPTSPVQNVYGWASYDFMYEGGGRNKVDAHTYIHETGHLLGLDDYYNYDEESSYSPMGSIAMMDNNVTDHDAWSKMVLGWQNPQVVTGNAEITLNPAQLDGDSILIADSWNGTSYDEFLLLELYTPTGLNLLDSTKPYAGGGAVGYTVPGIRMLHVDSRLGKYSYSERTGNWDFAGYFEPTTLYLTGDNEYDFAHSNTPSESENKDYRLLHMIQATNSNTFKFGAVGTNDDLFKTGNTFSMATYGSNFFKNGAKLNNGNALGYTINFVNVSASSATIRIIKS